VLKLITNEDKTIMLNDVARITKLYL